MRIITVNLPIPYLKVIDSLIGEKGLYPSRSELIRVAVRDFLIQEIEIAINFNPPKKVKSLETNHPPDLDDNLFIRVPINTNNDIDGLEYKTYRIVKK